MRSSVFGGPVTPEEREWATEAAEGVRRRYEQRRKRRKTTSIVIATSFTASLLIFVGTLFISSTSSSHVTVGGATSSGATSRPPASSNVAGVSQHISEAIVSSDRRTVVVMATVGCGAPPTLTIRSDNGRATLRLFAHTYIGSCALARLSDVRATLEAPLRGSALVDASNGKLIPTVYMAGLPHLSRTPAGFQQTGILPYDTIGPLRSPVVSEVAYRMLHSQGGALYLIDAPVSSALLSRPSKAVKVAIGRRTGLEYFDDQPYLVIREIIFREDNRWLCLASASTSRTNAVLSSAELVAIAGTINK
jgi:hypothetical protein